MDQPWGLSGPQFLDIYGAGMVIMVAVPLLTRALVRRVPARGRKWDLDPYEVAYLAGGSARAADVAIAELTHSGAVRVDSGGRLSMADPGAAASSLACTRYGLVPASYPDGLRTAQTRYYLRKSPGIAAIAGRLRASGLMMSGRRAATPSLATVILAVALLVTGALRIHEGVTRGRPVGNLSAEVFVTVIIALFLSVVLAGLTRTTTLGKACLRDLRRARGNGAFASPGAAGLPSPGSGLAGALAAPLGGAMMFGVALAGFAAVEDPGLRSALFAGLPSASGGSSGGSSCGSSSSCGGGSSCGGSSCGGGGCGGGGCGG